MTAVDPDRMARLEVMEGAHFWSVGRDHLTRLLLTRYDMSPPYLDAGAGTARFARTLAAKHRSVYWFDIGAVDPPGFRASITSIPLAPGSVGTVFARDVLEHVDDVAALAECHRVLRPGGVLLVTVPGWPSLWGPRDVVSGHLRRYRRRDLRRVVEAAGFVVEEMRGYQFLLLPLVVISRLLTQRSGPEALHREERIGGRTNALLTAINHTEAGAARWKAVRPPTGSTLVMIARRP